MSSDQDNNKILKSLREYLAEDAIPTNTTSGVANSDSPPLFKSEKFAGCECIEVDDDTYMKCKFGKKPYSRWSGVVEDEPLRNFIQKRFKANDKLIVKNSKTGSMTYLKR